MKSVTTLQNLLAAALLCSATIHSQANEPYDDEGYSEETYQESYQDAYQDESYPEENYQDTYQQPDAMEPEMDADQANQLKEVRSMCQQWAQESGMEGEDRTAYIDDCVYSQTGF